MNCFIHSLIWEIVTEFLPCCKQCAGWRRLRAGRAGMLLPPWSYQASDRCSVGMQGILGRRILPVWAVHSDVPGKCH